MNDDVNGVGLEENKNDDSYPVRKYKYHFDMVLV